MRDIHEQHKNWSEAGMCAIHAAAVVAEQLRLMPDSKVPGGLSSMHCPCKLMLSTAEGAALFTKITPNVLTESSPEQEISRQASHDGGRDTPAVNSGTFSVNGEKFML